MLTFLLAAMLPMAPTHTVPSAQEAQPESALQRRARRGDGEGGVLARRRGGGGGDAENGPGAGQSLPPGSTLIRYGDSADQRIRLWPAPASSAAGIRPPLAVFVHGGGWQHGTPEMVAEKPAWFARHGWAFASVGYRLLPESPVEEQAADVGRALRQLRADAARLGYDPDRILLFGHSAGAHLSALVATNPDYAGDAFAAIRGVIPIDGACYDVVEQMRDGGRFMMQRTYVPAFGTDPARHRTLSPTTHAGGRDAPDWLLLYTSARDDAARQSRLLSDALLRGTNVRAQLFEVPAHTARPLAAHREINVEFGTADYAANDLVLAMMHRIAGVR